MSLQSEADAVLHGAVANGDVPGVVAAATDRDGTIYEGGFGERVIGSGIAMTTDTVGWIASMTKALTGTAAMQLVEQGRLELDRPAADWVPELSEAQVLEGFADDGEPLTRPPRRPITLRHLLTHTAGFSLRDLERGDHPLPGGKGHPRHHQLPERRPEHPAAVRPGRALGVRHQHRLGRQDGRGGERQAARRLHAGAHLRAARHARYRVQAEAGHARAPGQDPSARRRRRLHGARSRDPAGAGIRHGRRRPLRHRGRLPEVRAPDSEPGRGGWPARSCNRRRST